METWVSTVETSIKRGDIPIQSLQSKQNPSIDTYEFSINVLRRELVHLKKFIKEKYVHIEHLQKENEYLYTELDRSRAQLEEERDRSDNLIDKMQTAAEESSQRAQTIIMHLSQQLERQAEEISILRNSKGLREKVRQLASKITFPRIGLIKLGFQSRSNGVE